MAGVLLAAAGDSGLAHDLTDSFVILAIALINAVIGFLQEYLAERDMGAIPAKAKELAGQALGGDCRVLQGRYRQWRKLCWIVLSRFFGNQYRAGNEHPQSNFAKNERYLYQPQ